MTARRSAPLVRNLGLGLFAMAALLGSGLPFQPSPAAAAPQAPGNAVAQRPLQTLSLDVRLMPSKPGALQRLRFDGEAFTPNHPYTIRTGGWHHATTVASGVTDNHGSFHVFGDTACDASGTLVVTFTASDDAGKSTAATATIPACNS